MGFFIEARNQQATSLKNVAFFSERIKNTVTHQYTYKAFSISYQNMLMQEAMKQLLTKVMFAKPLKTALQLF